MKKNGSGALLTVFLAVLIDLMGFGIILPLLPFYASSFQASALQIGFLYSIYSFAQLIFSPIWGSISDRIGRRPIMLFSTFGSCLAYLIFAFSNSLGVLFMSRLLAGIMGGNIATAQAYVADVTLPEERTKGMGMIGAAFGIGFAIGPAISTILIHPAFLRWFHVSPEHRFMTPGFFAAFLSLMSFFMVLFKLKETVHLDRGASRHSKEKGLRIVRSSIFSKKFWQDVMEEKKYAKHFFPVLMLCMFLLSFGHASLYSAFPIFCKFELNMLPENVGMLFVYMGIVVVVIQGGLIKRLTHLFGEEKLFLVGSILMVIGFILIPFARTVGAMAAVLSLMSAGGSLNGPTLNSLISKESHPAKMGATLGTAQGVSGLARAIGPAWGGLLYDVSHRLPFFASAALLSFTIKIGFNLVKAHRAPQDLAEVANLPVSEE